jgi:DNA-binding transcriptional ArsR family regulator
MSTAPELVRFFKALADETRLQLVGLLARRPHSGEELAAILAVKPATISHHLTKLAEAGLVRSAAQGHSKLYALRLDAIHAMAGRLLAKETLPATTDDLDHDAFDRKVVRGFLQRDGALKEIPAQQKKLQAVLRHLVKAFEPGRQYSEKQVNETLARYHEDTASLRRSMIGYKLMRRAEGKYWRIR